MKLKLWRIAQAAIVAASLLSVAWYFYLSNSYYDRLPRAPNPAAGRVYRDNFHGFILYETHREQVRLRSSEGVMFVLVFLALAGGLVSEWYIPARQENMQLGNHRRPPWNHRWGP